MRPHAPYNALRLAYVLYHHRMWQLPVCLETPCLLLALHVKRPVGVSLAVCAGTFSTVHVLRPRYCALYGGTKTRVQYISTECVWCLSAAQEVRRYESLLKSLSGAQAAQVSAMWSDLTQVGA